MNVKVELCSRRNPSARISRALVVLFFIVFLGGQQSAQAQYMFLDVNGDSLNTQEDFWQFIGPTDTATVDVYLVTNGDRFGGAHACSPETPGLNSYTVNLYCPQSAAVFSQIENKVPRMEETYPAVATPYGLSVSYYGTETLAPGKYHLFRVKVTSDRIQGCPDLEIVPYSCFSPPGTITSFGSGCMSTQGDDVLRLGIDWLSTGGLGGCTDFPGRVPNVTCPGEVTVREMATLTFPVSVFDPDCEIFSFYWEGVPEGAVFHGVGPIAAGEARGTFTWTPARGQAGTYDIMFTASDPPYGLPPGWQYWDTCTTRVYVLAPNRAPAAKAGGPYTGVQDVPVAFDGSQSSDPDGDALRYLWDLGDAATATGPTPLHTYGSGGAFRVTLTVTDIAELSAQDTTIASISSVLPARVFTKEGQPTKLPDGKRFTCFRIEPTAPGAFRLEEIVPSSIRLHYENTSCGGIDAPVDSRKSFHVADTDGNGLPELEACFGQENLAALLPCLPPGTNTVTLELRASLSSGGVIRGQFTHTFRVKTGSLDASVSPNPLRPTSALEFTTTSRGFVKIWLFDVHGRRVATLLDQSSFEAGDHRMPVAGLDALGKSLPSGIYFVRLVTEHDGAEARTVTILK